jgi:hypothetical protein
MSDIKQFSDAQESILRCLKEFVEMKLDVSLGDIVFISLEKGSRRDKLLFPQDEQLDEYTSRVVKGGTWKTQEGTQFIVLREWSISTILHELVHRAKPGLSEEETERIALDLVKHAYEDCWKAFSE